MKLLKRKIFNCEPSAPQKARNLIEIASPSLASMGIGFLDIYDTSFSLPQLEKIFYPQLPFILFIPSPFPKPSPMSAMTESVIIIAIPPKAGVALSAFKSNLSLRALPQSGRAWQSPSGSLKKDRFPSLVRITSCCHSAPRCDTRDDR